MPDQPSQKPPKTVHESRSEYFPAGPGRWVRVGKTPELSLGGGRPEPEVDPFAIDSAGCSHHDASVATASPATAASVSGAKRMNEGTWTAQHKFITSLCAGAVAGLSVDLTLYPLDTLRARLQAPAGFVAAGGFSSLYRGIGVALVGSAPCSAIFFGTFEVVKAPVGRLVYSTLGFQSPVTTNAMAAILGELTASCLRAPVEMFKQRQQTNTVAQRTSLYVGWKATLVRDLPFSTIQYPLYNVVKGLISDYRQRPLDPWQAAFCGSATSAVAAALTTPLDLVQTRLMLDTTNTGPKTVSGMLFKIHSEEGVPGFFRGVLPRSLWMGLGGLIFLGTYEQAKVSLQGGHDADTREAGMSLVAGSRLAAADAAATVPMDAFRRGQDVGDDTSEVGYTGAVALLSGALAGFAIDGFLHPIDTLKARSMSAESRPMGFSFRSFVALWEGLGAALLPAIPASAVFFMAYETLKKGLEQNRLFTPHADDGVPNAVACSCVAAGVAEGFACLLRVPAESMKMRLQAGQDATFGQAFRRCYSNGGARAFYRALGATLLLDVPFALLQYPIYEAAKNYFAERRLLAARSSCNATHSTVEAAPLSVSNLVDGALSGAVAGAVAGCVTTPLDVVRTRHVLSPLSRESLGTSFLDTAEVVFRTDGVHGLFRGCIPRTVYMCIGGAVYLGTYTACGNFLTPLLKDVPR